MSKIKQLLGGGGGGAEKMSKKKYFVVPVFFLDMYMKISNNLI